MNLSVSQKKFALVVSTVVAVALIVTGSLICANSGKVEEAKETVAMTNGNSSANGNSNANGNGKANGNGTTTCNTANGNGKTTSSVDNVKPGTETGTTGADKGKTGTETGKTRGDNGKTGGKPANNSKPVEESESESSSSSSSESEESESESENSRTPNPSNTNNNTPPLNTIPTPAPVPPANNSGNGSSNVSTDPSTNSGANGSGGSNDIQIDDPLVYPLNDLFGGDDNESVEDNGFESSDDENGSGSVEDNGSGSVDENDSESVHENDSENDQTPTGNSNTSHTLISDTESVEGNGDTGSEDDDHEEDDANSDAESVDSENNEDESDDGETVDGENNENESDDGETVDGENNEDDESVDGENNQSPAPNDTTIVINPSSNLTSDEPESHIENPVITAFPQNNGTSSTVNDNIPPPTPLDDYIQQNVDPITENAENIIIPVDESTVDENLDGDPTSFLYGLNDDVLRIMYTQLFFNNRTAIIETPVTDNETSQISTDHADNTNLTADNVTNDQTRIDNLGNNDAADNATTDDVSPTDYEQQVFIDTAITTPVDASENQIFGLPPLNDAKETDNQIDPITESIVESTSEQEILVHRSASYTPSSNQLTTTRNLPLTRTFLGMSYLPLLKLAPLVAPFLSVIISGTLGGFFNCKFTGISQGGNGSLSLCGIEITLK